MRPGDHSRVRRRDGRGARLRQLPLRVQADLAQAGQPSGRSEFEGTAACGARLLDRALERLVTGSGLGGLLSWDHRWVIFSVCYLLARCLLSCLRQLQPAVQAPEVFRDLRQRRLAHAGNSDHVPHGTRLGTAWAHRSSSSEGEPSTYDESGQPGQSGHRGQRAIPLRPLPATAEGAADALVGGGSLAVEAVGVDLERNSDAVAGAVATSVSGTPALSHSDPAACRSRRIGGPGVGLLEFHSDYVQGPRRTESPTRYAGGLPCSAWTLMLLKISAFTVCDGSARPCG